MPEFQADAHCSASARQVWKLLYDPHRFAQWWPGWERVEMGESAELTHYDARWPDFAYPATVSTDPSSGRVVVSCALSDIVHTWSIDPGEGGCRIAVVVMIPEEESDRTGEVTQVVRHALTALVAHAEGLAEEVL